MSFEQVQDYLKEMKGKHGTSSFHQLNLVDSSEYFVKKRRFNKKTGKISSQIIDIGPYSLNSRIVEDSLRKFVKNLKNARNIQNLPKYLTDIYDPDVKKRRKERRSRK